MNSSSTGPHPAAPTARLPAALILLILAALLLAAPSAAERSQRGNLIVSLSGGISPLALPRHDPVPVALRIGGRIATAQGAPLPRLTHINLQIAGRGALQIAGLPLCRRARIAHATSTQAHRRCRGALLGTGSLTAQAFVPRQAPFPLHARLLAFNGRAPSGLPAIWVHAYSAEPPLSLILPFIVHRHGPRLATSLTATVPPALGDLPHLSSFALNLFRRYRHLGEPRSYLSASCPIPASFTAGFLAFAKATYSFADGRNLRVEAVRSCRAR